MMEFSISPQIFEKFPELHVGVVIAKDIDNNGASTEIGRLLMEEGKRIRENFDSETISQHPKIAAWRKAYAAFGAKPSDYRCSVENLYRLVLKGGDIRHINKLVDIYNFISLKYTLPLGGEDIAAIRGNIQLTLASANEPAVLLLGDKDSRPPHEGEVIYKDETSAICRRFNWREADRTKLGEETRNAILVAEGLPPATKEEIQTVVNELSGFVNKSCGGECDSYLLNSGNSRIKFEVN